ncbi:MAG: sensor histidine kinase [Planctomycetota bacterium]
MAISTLNQPPLQQARDRRHQPGLSGGLGRRILLWTLTLSIVPVVIVAFQGHHCATEALVDSARSDVGGAAIALQQRLETWIEERHDDLTVLGAIPGVIRAVHSGAGGEGPTSRSDILQAFQVLQRQVPAYRTVWLFDREGTLITSLLGNGIEEADSARSDILGLLRAGDGPPVGRLLRGKGGEVSIQIGVPLEEAPGSSPQGFLLAALDLSQALQPILDDACQPETSGTAYLVDSGRAVVAAAGSRNEGQGATVTMETVGVRRALEGKSGADVYDDSRGVSVVGGYAPLRALDAAVLVERPRSEALEWVHILAMRASVVGLVTILAVSYFSARISRHLSRPMRVLAEVARRIRDGERQTRVPDLGGAEAAAVGRALNEMLDRLEEAHRRLVHAATLAAIGEFSSGIVHEIRNPLSSIKLNLQALETHVEQDPEHAELASIAKQQTLRIEKMLGDLLAYSRPLELHWAEHSLGALIDESVRGVAPEAQQRDIEVRTEIPAEPVLALVDAERLVQAMTNLLRNALQAIDRHGEASVRLGTTQDTATSHALARIEVEDDGPGVAEANIDRLFRPFFTTKEMGTGLGLANVKKIVEYHGGRVTGRNRERSAAGHGALFTIELPIRRAAE